MKRHKLLIGAGVVASVVAAIVLWGQFEFARESYQGRHTRDWALQLAATATDGNESNRVEAIAALQALGPAAIPPLRRMLAERESFYDRTVARIAALLPVNQRRTLVTQLRPGQALSHRAAAVNALMVLGTNALSAIPDLGQALYDPSGGVRLDAARALVSFGDVAIPALIAAATGTNPVVRHIAVYALAQSATNLPLTRSTLLTAMLDDDENVRTTAIYFADPLGLDAQPLLLEKLRSPDPAEQLGAVRALAGVRLPSQLIATNLLSLATNSSGELRRQTIETMSALRMMTTNAAAVMIAALDDPDPAIRITAMRAVGQLTWKTGAAIPRLTEFTRSAHQLERKTSVWALAQFGARASNAIPALTLLLDDPDPEVRKAATGALTQIDPPPN